MLKAEAIGVLGVDSDVGLVDLIYVVAIGVKELNVG